MDHLSQLQQAIAPHRQALLSHPVYEHLTGLSAISQFMEAHVFAVWDFMSLVKSLQRQLTCTTLPWKPVGSASTRFLINEIVVGEESDVDPEGGFISHYELYLRAMKQAGASTTAINLLNHQLSAGLTWEEALAHPDLPAGPAAFTRFTLSVATNAPVGVLAAVFTFGREDLIPGMFMAMISQLSAEDQEMLAVFKYYLERHIEVDGDHHSHLALAMTQELLGDNEEAWSAATEVVIKSLQSRKALWDGVLAQLTGVVYQ